MFQIPNFKFKYKYTRPKQKTSLEQHPFNQ